MDVPFWAWLAVLAAITAAHAVRLGCTPGGVLRRLARIGGSGRSLTEQESAELYARHDQVMVDIEAPEDKP